MIQALYAHINNKKVKIKKKEIICGFGLLQILQSVLDQLLSHRSPRELPRL
jgi:hypothetical protein